MKAGLLTYHYVCNEGALWQAYSLLDAFRKLTPELHVEIVNYQMPAKAGWNEKTFSAGKAKTFQEFRESFVNGQTVTESALEDYGGVIVGSDIVWQFSVQLPILNRLGRALKVHPLHKGPDTCVNTLRHLKHWGIRIMDDISSKPLEWMTVPNPYWLPWKSEQIKISYSTSIGYSRPELLGKHDRAVMTALLADFQLISVRDDHTLAFVESLLDEPIEKIPDPAWLYEEPLKDMGEALERAGWDGKAPLAGVLYPRGNCYGQALDDWILDELRSMGYMTVSVIDRNPSTDIDLAAESLEPFDWWTVIARLDFLLTVRTHPNIAALKYHTPFLNLDITSAINGAQVSKSADMLTEFGFADHCIFRDTDLIEKNIKARLNQSLSKSWDWDDVDRQISRHRERSASFIRRAAALLHA
jgi:polysaccharide pyruvyl transferase WcaK-like protein